MRSITSALFVAIFAIALTACAVHEPMVYAYPVDYQSERQQYRDRRMCESWAYEQTGYEPDRSVARGAGVGAAIGAVAGTIITGRLGGGSVAGALAGGAIGAAHGFERSERGYARAYAACMRGRGYEVTYR